MSISRNAVLDWVKAYAAVINANKDYLVQLDSAIGDGDHGANMDRGFQAVLTKLPGVSDKDIGTVFKTVGMTLVSTVGGAGGPSGGRRLPEHLHQFAPFALREATAGLLDPLALKAATTSTASTTCQSVVPPRGRSEDRRLRVVWLRLV